MARGSKVAGQIFNANNAIFENPKYRADRTKILYEKIKKAKSLGILLIEKDITKLTMPEIAGMINELNSQIYRSKSKI